MSKKTITDEMINNLKEIIETNKNHDIVYNTFKVAEKFIKNGEVLFKIDPNRTGMLNGAEFVNEKDSNHIFLRFGQYFLDTYSKSSSIHHTILMHELKHVCDWAENKDTFFKSKAKKKYFYEFAARDIEAEFVKYYLDGNFNLTKLEKLLLDGYNYDDLYSHTIFFQKVDKNIYFIFKEFENDYQNNNISEEEIVKSVINGAIQLVDIFKLSGDDKSKFKNYISIKSFRDCLEDVVLKNDKNTFIFEDIRIKYYSNLENIHHVLYKIIDDNYIFYKKYSYLLDKNIEEYYI